MSFGNKRDEWLEALDEDIRHHIECEVEANIEAGMQPEEARRQALRKFGNVTRVREETRAVWSSVWLEQVVQDIRYAIRTLGRQPGFTFVVIAALATAIGLNTAVFSVLNTVLLRPLPYPAADRLIWLANYDQQWKQDNWIARVDYLKWKEQAHSFEKMAAYGTQDLAMVAGGEATQERVSSITGDFWSITGASPAAGRLFQPGDANTIVLSWRLFERRFGSDPKIVGQVIRVNGWPFTIAGVLSPEHRFLFPQQVAGGDEVRDTDAYIPIPDALMNMPPSGVANWDAATRRFGPAPFWICAVGLQKQSVAPDAARAEMSGIYKRVAEQDPGPLRQSQTLGFRTLGDKLSGNVREPLFLMLAASAAVLLIACTNIASLLLVRASTRQREIAIRASIGAGRARVILQLLTESLVLSVTGCAAGLLLAYVALRLMIRLAPHGVPRLTETALDGNVLAFAAAVSVFAALLFGLAPALAAWRIDLARVLTTETGNTSAALAGTRLRGWFVASEVALAMILVLTAGLLFKSFRAMNEKPPGFAPDRILTMRVTLSGPQYSVWRPKQLYTERLLQTLEALPGVESAAVDSGSFNTTVQLLTSADPLFASIRGVSQHYLRVMGVPLLKGSFPNSGTLSGVVVNESFARLAGGDPTGKHIGGSILNDTITGVVADVKTWQLDSAVLPEIYLPYERLPLTRSTRVLVRAAGGAEALAPAIRSAATGIDRSQPVYEVRTLEDALAGSIAPRRFQMLLLGTFAATAMVLALTGIYGLIAYSVSRRTREIGIRIALGARRGEILRLILREAVWLSLAGIVCGILGALGLARVIAGLLYGVSASDPWTFLAAALLMLAAAVLAAAAPALKAARVNPVVALRCE